MPSLSSILWLSSALAMPLQQLERWPASQAPTADVASTARALATRTDPALAKAHIEVRTASFGFTALVYRQQYGLRSAEPDLVIRLDPSGHPRLSAHRPATVTGPPAHFLAPDALPARIEEQLPGAAVRTVGPLRWWPAETGSLRAARLVALQPQWRGLVAPVALVSAEGTVLHLDETATHSTADVYLTDPLLDPDVVRVDLPSFAGESLHTRHFDLNQCADLGLTYTTNSALGEVEVRGCEPRAALWSADKDWIFEPVPYPLDPALDQDRFALPQLAWHGEQVVDLLVTLGLPIEDVPRDWTRLQALANLRTPDLRDTTTMSDADAPLMPYDNAYFRRAYERSDGTWTDPEICFGQGSLVDFAYDADVITHELGHWAVWMQGGPSSVRSSVHGSSAEPGALNEGLADYLAAVRQEDPEIGVYSGDGFGRPYIRTLDGDARCPDSVYGQVHADSQPFSQALWGFRTTLTDAEQAVLDRAVIDALPVIGSRGGFSEAVEALVAEVELQLGSAAASGLQEAFADRQVDDCRPHIRAVNGEEVRSYTRVPAHNSDLYDGPIPGYVQFIVDADGPLEVTFELVQKESLEVDLYDIHEPKRLLVLAKAGGPIEHRPYTDEDSELWVWENDGEQVGTVDWVEELETALDGRSRTHAFAGSVSLYGDGPHYLQLAHTSARIATATNIVLSWEAGEPREDTGAADDSMGEDRPKQECGCAASPRGGLGLLALAGLALFRRRRPSGETALRVPAPPAD